MLFSGVTSSGRVWRKVPESDARSVGLNVAYQAFAEGLNRAFRGFTEMLTSSW